MKKTIIIVMSVLIMGFAVIASAENELTRTEILQIADFISVTHS